MRKVIVTPCKVICENLAFRIPWCGLLLIQGTGFKIKPQSITDSKKSVFRDFGFLDFGFRIPWCRLLLIQGNGFQIKPQWIPDSKKSVFRDFGFLDFGFRIPWCRLLLIQGNGFQIKPPWIPDSKRSVFPGFRIPKLCIIGFRIPKNRISQSTSNCFLDSGLSYMER